MATLHTLALPAPAAPLSPSPDITAADITAADIAAVAAEAFRRRDELAAELRLLDTIIKGLTRDYGTAARVWGLTPLMLRHACEARGLLHKDT